MFGINVLDAGPREWIVSIGVDSDTEITDGAYSRKRITDFNGLESQVVYRLDIEVGLASADVPP